MNAMKAVTYILFALAGMQFLGALHPVLEAYLKEEAASRPRTHFYTRDAYENCKAMGAEARRRGFTAWTCHKPQPVWRWRLNDQIRC